MWCGVVWCGVVWCGVVLCGVVLCGVVWCGKVHYVSSTQVEENRLYRVQKTQNIFVSSPFKDSRTVFLKQKKIAKGVVTFFL